MAYKNLTVSRQFGSAGHTVACLVAKELGTKLGVGGMDGNVDGTDVQIDDALRLTLGKVGERDIVAH